MPLNTSFFIIITFYLTIWVPHLTTFKAMSENFKIMSININGNIKNPEVKGRLLACVSINKINIILMQETHVASLKYKKVIDKEFNCDSYWSFGSNDSRGVAIFILKNFERDIIKFKRDNEGRVISVRLSSNLGNLNIVSSYAPNNVSDRKLFLKNLDNFLIGNCPNIIGSDWNMVENIKLDKVDGNTERGNEGITE